MGCVVSHEDLTFVDEHTVVTGTNEDSTQDHPEDVAMPASVAATSATITMLPSPLVPADIDDAPVVRAKSTADMPSLLCTPEEHAAIVQEGVQAPCVVAKSLSKKIESYRPASRQQTPTNQENTHPGEFQTLSTETPRRYFKSNISPIKPRRLRPHAAEPVTQIQESLKTSSQFIPASTHPAFDFAEQAPHLDISMNLSILCDTPRDEHRSILLQTGKTEIPMELLEEHWPEISRVIEEHHNSSFSQVL